MILGHQPAFIFIHVWKSGGTSIQRALESLPIRLARETAATRALRFVRRALHRSYVPLGKHAYLLDVRRRMDPEAFASHFKFGFVRNPWDWLVSWYHFVRNTRVSPDTGKPWKHHLHKYVEGKDFPAFVDWVTEEHGLCLATGRRRSSFRDKRPFLQKDWLADDAGRLLVDFTGRFENLHADFKAVCTRIGLPDVDLPHVNKADHAPYRKYYDGETREKVAAYFSEDIETFGYKF
jgi:hypothetical protein